MCSTVWLSATYYAALISFPISALLNLIVLGAIGHRKVTAIGNYKYLMMSFSLWGIGYSLNNFLVMPMFHINRTSFFMFTAIEWPMLLKDSVSFAMTACSIHQGIMLSILSVQFYYRYISVTAPVFLFRKFSSQSLIFWLPLIFLYTAIWGCTTYFLYEPTENKDRELDKELYQAYCLTPTNYTYAGPQYLYDIPESGRRRYHLPSFFGIGIRGIQMIIFLSCVAWCGFYTYLKLFHEEGLTCYFRKALQKQLFKALCIQTAIPFVMMYIPLFFLSVFSMFGMKIKIMADLISISMAIYPCLQPLATMIYLKDVRIRTFGCLTFFTPRRNRRIQMLDESTASATPYAIHPPAN